MATPESIAIRRADALAAVATATQRIAAATGAAIADYPAPHKQHGMRPAIEAEWLAGALGAIADAVDPDGAATPDAEPEQLGDLKRDDLNAHAAEQGVDNAEDYPNKDALAAAIEHGDPEPAVEPGPAKAAKGKGR